MSERVISEPGLPRGTGGAPHRINLLEVEDAARAMIVQAQRKVEELSRKTGELEEQFRKRREELAEEYRGRREILDDELAEIRNRTEKELDALRKEVKETTHKEALDEGYQEGFLRGREDGLKEGRTEGHAQGYKEGLEETGTRLGGELERVTASLQAILCELVYEFGSRFKYSCYEV